MKLWGAASAVFALSLVVASCQTSKSYEDPGALAQLISGQSEPYFLIDVRTPGEYSSGHIPSAVNIPVDSLESRLPTEDRSALVIVYCQSGRRSAAAARTLTGLGFTRVIDFGAVSRWGGTLVTGDAPR